jgi:hypothetical protein
MMAWEREVRDRGASAPADEKLAAPDAMQCYWDELFNAVCARLEQLAQHSAEPSMQAGVRECVAALAQLHASFDDERARQRQQAADLMAFQPPRDPR